MAHTASEQSELRALCRRVRWRLKLQQALRVAVVVAIAACGVAAGLVLAARIGWLETGALTLAVLGAGVATGLAFLGGAALRRVTDIEAAWRLDKAAGLHDRLGSAIAFARVGEPTPMQAAAIRDAARHVGRADAKAAAPWQRPAGLGWMALALAVLVAAVWVQLPSSEVEGRALARLVLPPMQAREKARILDEDAAHAEEQAKALADQAAKTEDPEVKQWISELNDLLRALQEGKLTPEEAHARMAELQQARDEWSKKTGDDEREIAEHLKKAAKKTKHKHRALDPMLEALRQQHWLEASRALRDLADRVERKEFDKKQREKLGKDLQKLSEAMKTEAQKREERLKKERDRLKKKQEKKKDRFAKKDRDRLKKKERQLERLQRERQRNGAEMRRHLERLQRDMDKAAQDLLRRLADQSQQMSAEDMRRAADMLRRLSEQAQGRKQMRIAEARLVDIEEMMRRAGQRQQGQGQDGQGQGQNGQGKDGKGKKMERFLVLAKGQGQEGGDNGQGQGQEGEGRGKDGDKGEQLTMLGKDGKGGDMLLLGKGMGGAPVPVPGTGQGDPGGAELGEGVGEGHDPNLLGERTDNTVKTHDEFVQGRDAGGPSESRVVFAAARKGFTTQSWKAVHQDYSGVVEEQLERQEIPAGKRRYVRRYFDLIRPR